MQGVDSGQFRHPSSAGQGSNVVHPPQDQLTIDGVGVMECPCSCITKLLPTNGKVRLLLISIAFQQCDPCLFFLLINFLIYSISFCHPSVLYLGIPFGRGKVGGCSPSRLPGAEGGVSRAL